MFKWFLTIFSLGAPEVWSIISDQNCTTRSTIPVFIRLNVAVFVKLLEFPMRHLFTGKGGVYPMEGGVYFEITFFKSLTTVIINRL